MTNPQAGWYSDPSNPSQLRWWDGTQWTNNTQAVQGTAQASAPQRPVTTTSSSYSAVPQSPLAANSGSAQPATRTECTCCHARIPSASCQLHGRSHDGRVPPTSCQLHGRSGDGINHPRFSNGSRKAKEA